MQGQNTVEEVLCLSVKRGYTVFYRNHKDNNVLIDIVVAHPTSIEMMRTWPYVLIMDTTYKINKHYLRTSHGLPCACELITWLDHVLPIQLSDIEAFWKTLEIGGCHPSTRQQNMDSEMRSLTNLLHHISTGPISKVREMRRLAKGVLSLVFLEDPGVILTSPPKVAVTKGQKKMNSTKRDKSYWEHVSIAHRKIQKSSGSGSGLGSGSRSWSGLGSKSGSVREGDRHELLEEGAEGETMAKVVYLL
ncbi:hypothetical protein M9H77_12057 [Catharanthus roseus]|uniref:Uncharacterized protein n=1 Tax=Catharanthus roseus TaxID=4058 RepID=A0ACC0BGJ3_CATRO|nr:hypothetical protein M9H77_12057 [Catharanthus roseus]